MGHLIPFAELARRLVADHDLGATLLFAAATDTPSEQYASVAASVPDGVNLVALPAPPALPSTAPVRERATHAAVSSVPHVREIARSLTSTAPLAALVVDMVSVPARDVATELGVPCYMFFTSPWMLLSLFLHLPEIDAGLVGEYRDATEPIRLPGCVPIHAHDLPGSMLVDRSSDTFGSFLSLAKEASRVDGILVNTFSALEPVVGDGTDGVTELPVHAVGPLVWTRPAGVNRDHSRVIRWLDQQPRGSVVYLSFGSGGTLTWRQTTELALALEMTGCRFLWVVNRPDEDTASGAFFGTRPEEDVDDDALGFLPRGFVERTSELGLVLPSWAPQTAILAHASVGCFVTHCGWNSSLESILNGVPMVAWPLYAEQKMNAAMLEVQDGVAVRVHADAHGFFSKEEIAGVIRRVMDGEEGACMRRCASELKDKAEQALTEEGGSSALALGHVAGTWRSSCT
ncbi:hydroquinone glucosyltransferase-like [Lolium rigidum]|uniref:hydroquinone glucosyltransferase-like n=1 Tax=Lolium rigidum TaxID=89674 RepID=UPI001F5D3CBC|nr:hydroquinone glucosyltransferase-like [Lolium rigidum]